MLLVPCTRIALTVSLAALALLGAPRAQGEFVNFESGAVKPLTVARVGGFDYLLACNIPDNSVEIYDTRDHSLVTRVPVGLRPVTVVWNETLGRFYTANFVGDSVSAVQLAYGPNGLTTTLEGTVPVGDEPTDITFLPDNLSFFVTLAGHSCLGWHSAVDLSPLRPLDSPRESVWLTDEIEFPKAKKALKEPRRTAIVGTSVVTLAGKGGNSTAFDLDYLVIDPITGQRHALGQLGSANFNMAFDATGRMFSTGWLARNEIRGEPALVTLPTGFVESHLYVVDALTGSPTVLSRDLNRDSTGTIVPASRALAMPTDVAIYPDEIGLPGKLFVAAFGSDRIGVLHPNANAPATWPLTYIDVPNLRGDEDYSRSGPRAFALKRPSLASEADPGWLLYGYNQLNHSISVIDPEREVVLRTIHLANDPTPSIVRTGREFLHGAHLSGNGFTSCASCHIDGRTDGLSWILGEITAQPGPAVPTELLDGITIRQAPQFFPGTKGPLVTQTLQGLLNHPATGDAKYLVTNAPYHWRGDKAGIEDFNGAFVLLMGGPNIGTPQSPAGITTAQMTELVGAIDSIMYPPNPEQPKERVYSGTFGSANLEDGTGAQRGLKLYHTRGMADPINAGRSCCMCHELPEGSNNKITVFDMLQPLESAQLRGFKIREGKLDVRRKIAVSPIQLSEFGMASTGEASMSLDQFFLGGFLEHYLTETDKLLDLMQFGHELDWGIAPIVGHSLTVRDGFATASWLHQQLDLLEGQVRNGNAGLAVLLHGPRENGWWFDLTANPPGYRSTVSGNVGSRAQLLAVLAGTTERLVFQATPAGSARRVATLDGAPAPLQGPAPSGLVLEPMIAPAHWDGIAAMTKNWVRGTGPNQFNWNGQVNGNAAPEPVSVKAKRLFLDAIAQTRPSWGVTGQRHDPPRRFQIAGDDIRPGAVLEFDVPAEPGVQPPYAQGSGDRVDTIYLDLVPTDRLNTSGQRIWQTTAELGPHEQLMLLVGGPEAPGVAAANLGQVAEPAPAGTFDPVGWNWYRFRVRNADGTVRSGGWQRLTVQ